MKGFDYLLRLKYLTTPKVIKTIFSSPVASKPHKQPHLTKPTPHSSHAVTRPKPQHSSIHSSVFESPPTPQEPTSPDTGLQRRTKDTATFPTPPSSLRYLSYKIVTRQKNSWVCCKSHDINRKEQNIANNQKLHFP